MNGEIDDPDEPDASIQANYWSPTGAGVIVGGAPVVQSFNTSMDVRTNSLDAGGYITVANPNLEYDGEANTIVFRTVATIGADNGFVIPPQCGVDIPYIRRSDGLI